MVRNWKYYLPGEDIGELQIPKGQYMTGNIMGVLVEKKESITPNSTLTNAYNFDFPVRYKLIEKYCGENLKKISDEIIKKITELETEGCRFIVTTGGQLGRFDALIHETTDLLAVSTPLILSEYAALSLAKDAWICVVNNLSWVDSVEILRLTEISSAVIDRCVFADMELRSYHDSSGNVLNLKETKIGAYLWDSTEDYQVVLKDVCCPVYDMTKIADLLKNAVMQIPYGGGI